MFAGRLAGVGALSGLTGRCGAELAHDAAPVFARRKNSGMSSKSSPLAPSCGTAVVVGVMVVTAGAMRGWSGGWSSFQEMRRSSVGP
jgi:hypothetical protein